ncbi:MAG TPA: Holliday junction resolvase RuvX [Acidimicrobiales bacterium]|jgi:putative Holliday junction resolvase|nr:Holliday junction resolvase RuvX [Acidimicrobiales bacterium]
MRAVGLDLGTRRIGVAVSDSGGIMATPYSVIERSGDPEVDRKRVAEVVAEVGAEAVVVGLPLSMDGTVGPAATAASAEAAALRQLLAVPVELQDERLTSVTANRSLAAAGVTGRRRSRAARQAGAVDSTAAAILLQSWLDGRK